MDAFTKLMNTVNTYIWSTPLVALCLIAGFWFSIRMKFPQIRLIRDMNRLLVHGEKSDSGITPFQAFATTVGSRVGMGNIAGVATALFFGGPGAIFWMWILALIGAASAFMESALAQAYKRKKPDGEYIGGPAYFIEQAIHCKPYAVAFAIATLLGPGILMPGVHINSIASTFHEAFGISSVAVAVVAVLLLGLVICGGIGRIASVAEYLSPIMCVIYLILGIAVIALNVSKVPGVFGLIFSSAFGANAIYGGILGSAIAWGVKRGVYSNEAGQGSGAIVSAAAECSHPAKQGLIQALSVYIDTLVVCTISALIMLLTGFFNVTAADGSLITEGIPGVQYGILWVQDALNNAFGGTWSGKLLACVLTMFVFTSLMGYYYEAESNLNYLSRGNKTALWIFRFLFLFSCFSGVLMDGQVIWTMGDTGAGLMAWLNIIAILILSKKGFALLADYEEQKKKGLDPCFDPAKFGIDDPTHTWDRYKDRNRTSHES